MKKFFSIGLMLASMLMSSTVDAGSIEAFGRGIDQASAIRSALRAAIEEEIGVLVDSKTIVKNHQTIENEIVLKSSGFIEGYEILSSRMLNGVYEVRLLANVRSDQIRSTLMSALEKKTLVETTMNNPRLKVIAQDDRGNELIEVENEFIAALKSQGFERLIDSEDRADYVVQIMIKDTTAGARIVDAGGGIIYAQTFDLRRRMFSDTRTWAIKNAARILANAALEHAAKLEQFITIIYSDPDLDLSRIRSIDGVNGVFRRTLTEVDVTYDGSASDLASALERAGFSILELNAAIIKI